MKGLLKLVKWMTRPQWGHRLHKKYPMKDKIIRTPETMPQSTLPASKVNQQTRAKIRAAMAKRVTMNRLLIDKLLSVMIMDRGNGPGGDLSFVHLILYHYSQAMERGEVPQNNWLYSEKCLQNLLTFSKKCI